MKMLALQMLHKDMLRIQTEMQQFQVVLGAVSFDCLFSIRDTPCYKLSLTTRGIDPKFFIFDVKPGYWIEPYFKDFFYELAGVLNTGAFSGNKLIPKDFLAGLNEAIPTKAKAEREPSPQAIIDYRPDILEDRDKPYFDTWIYWKESGRKPSKDNLHKTRLLFGQKAYEYSLHFKASSKWSASDLQRDWKRPAQGKKIA
ncbi:DUF6037 family protein [Candidatus Sororendozoicomonas aggregata]|uniref:DUF6037 family protein n=1 Tax=Candidatus Sororendozoicomonas aggregata TaxID=3073239 RepID=UPI002ED1E664